MPPGQKKPTRDATNLGELRDQMAKLYGTKVVRQEQIRAQYEIVSTGSLTLDLAMRTGGLIRGRTHEFVGVEAVGKTTLAIAAMREHQKSTHKPVAYVDMEQTWDWHWAQANGLDVSENGLFYVFADNSEDVSDQIAMLLRPGLFSCIVVDSIGGMESKKALEKMAEESNMGKNAQIISRMVKNVAGLARATQTTVIFINQLRANFSSPTGGSISAGPKAFKYSTTMRVELSRVFGEGSQLKAKVHGHDEDVGKQIRARVTRSKVAPEGRTAEFYLINQETPDYGPIGIDQADEAIAIGVASGVIGTRGGGYYDLPSGEAVRGRLSLSEYLRAHRDEALKIRDLAVAKKVHEVVPEPVEVTFAPEDAVPEDASSLAVPPGDFEESLQAHE